MRRTQIKPQCDTIQTMAYEIVPRRRGPRLRIFRLERTSADASSKPEEVTLPFSSLSPSSCSSKLDFVSSVSAVLLRPERSEMFFNESEHEPIQKTHFIDGEGKRKENEKMKKREGERDNKWRRSGGLPFSIVKEMGV
jgi:hypothetical protein